jgi:ATP synthase protein I
MIAMSFDDDSDWHRDADIPVRPLTRSEAQALVAKHPSMSVWQVLGVQCAFGVCVALVWGALSRHPNALVSALWGVAVVVVPGAFMARGLFVWEFLKLGLTGAMLALAPMWIRPLDWAAMLVTLVLSLKVIGVALLVWQRRKKNFA